MTHVISACFVMSSRKMYGNRTIRQPPNERLEELRAKRPPPKTNVEPVRAFALLFWKRQHFKPTDFPLITFFSSACFLRVLGAAGAIFSGSQPLDMFPSSFSINRFIVIGWLMRKLKRGRSEATNKQIKMKRFIQYTEQWGQPFVVKWNDSLPFRRWLCVCSGFAFGH